jgi:ferredoxin
LVKKGLEEAASYAQDIIEGKTRWAIIPLLSDGMYLFYKIVITRMWLSNWNQKYFGFKVDKEKCTKCGLCVKICPVKNIKLDNFPVHGHRCNFCMRCVSWCPQKAIPCGFNFKGKTYTATQVIPAEWKVSES